MLHVVLIHCAGATSLKKVSDLILANTFLLTRLVRRNPDLWHVLFSHIIFCLFFFAVPVNVKKLR